MRAVVLNFCLLLLSVSAFSQAGLPIRFRISKNSKAPEIYGVRRLGPEWRRQAKGSRP